MVFDLTPATLATDALRALLHTLARHVPAADLIAVLDAERKWLAGLIEKEEVNDGAD